MKKFLLVALCFASVFAFAATAESDSVRRKTIARALYGRIRIVEVAEDYRVKEVAGFEDLRVKIVSSSPDSVGLWEIVEVAEDYRVRMVDTMEDIRVQFVIGGEGVAD